MHISNHNSSHAVQSRVVFLCRQGLDRWPDDVTRLHDLEQNFLLRSTGAATELLCSGCVLTNSIRCASSSAYPHWCVAPAFSGITVLAGKQSLSVEWHFSLHPSFSCNVKLKRQEHTSIWFQLSLVSMLAFSLYITYLSFFIIGKIKKKIIVLIFFREFVEGQTKPTSSHVLLYAV